MTVPQIGLASIRKYYRRDKTRVPGLHKSGPNPLLWNDHFEGGYPNETFHCHDGHFIFFDRCLRAYIHACRGVAEISNNALTRAETY